MPVLFDEQRRRIVNNESSEIIRMFNSAFDGVGAEAGDYYPAELREEIDALNARIYPTVNNGVYRCGFARRQPAYDEAVARAVRDARLDSRRGSPTAATCAASARPRPTGGCSRRWCASIRSMSACSSATCAGSPIIPTSAAISRTLRAWPGVEETIDYLPHQAPLLREPEVHQSDRDRAARTGRLRMDPKGSLRSSEPPR